MTEPTSASTSRPIPVGTTQRSRTRGPARRGPSQQIDLFGGEQNSAPVEIPAWQELPAEARVKLTDLMARLILDHVQRSRIEPATEAGHDL
ncbi:MAG TPA: hypothetical protein VE420_03595 [Gemmatimonadales bacterium]|jgi:hypothetical protein|nr:hypothetical protein [Gemmatimonadales bacterium]